jgi:ketosteroid isomerase-like protein
MDMANVPCSNLREGIDRGDCLRVLTGIFVALSLAVPACGLDRANEDKVRAANAAYVSGWLKNDQAAVLATLWPDAVLIPQGRAQIRGLDAIKAFWWPAAGPRTTIHNFAFTTDEVGGSRDVAYARGTYRFEYSLDGSAGTLLNVGNYLMIFRRSGSGEWRISHRMWGDAPH